MGIEKPDGVTHPPAIFPILLREGEAPQVACAGRAYASHLTLVQPIGQPCLIGEREEVVGSGDGPEFNGPVSGEGDE